MITHTVPTWQVAETGGLETSWIELGAAALHARGRVAAARPAPYWLTYELETGEGFVTRWMRVRAETADGVRELELRQDGGRWSVDGVERPDLAGALDCDLGLSPVTNTPPVLRHGLHRGPGERHFLMAWIRVPDLTVHPSRQTYTHLGLDGGRATVRYASGDFRSDLVLDRDGLVLDYPGLAGRIA
ncbi:MULTISPECIES: putative glycolipid-binding domain-containing protein [unclassified Kitasatospora]|uniref:putative glycolipid-binding domain-containing protein n=1 Tax=unclassified Kitasatospora TaxID=2633591 RepID=UPI00341A9456